MLSPDYVVGLVDGEGSFTVYIRNPEDDTERKRRVFAEPKFYVKFIEKDKDILYALRKFFGCGSVYFQKDARRNHQNCYRYEVVKRSDLEQTIIPFFRKHPLQLASKRKDFQLFQVLVKRICKGEHKTEAGLRKLYAIKRRMH